MPNVPGHPEAIVRPTADAPGFEVERVAPRADLAEFVDYHWLVRWSVPKPHRQQVVPQPRVHVAAEDGQLLVHGISRSPFYRTLTGHGHVLGAAFHAGGFRPLLKSSLGAISGTVQPGRDHGPGRRRPAPPGLRPRRPARRARRLQPAHPATAVHRIRRHRPEVGDPAVSHPRRGRRRPLGREDRLVRARLRIGVQRPGPPDPGLHPGRRHTACHLPARERPAEARPAPLLSRRIRVPARRVPPRGSGSLSVRRRGSSTAPWK